MRDYTSDTTDAYVFSQGALPLLRWCPFVTTAHSSRIDDLIEAFAAALPWPMDPFQLEAIRDLETHRALLVSAPTSSGKTVIAEYPIWKAILAPPSLVGDPTTPRHVIYTTPLKALSNQKFHDLQRTYGESSVGLVTGEHSINERAPVVVMTTEILRNVIYDDPSRLDMVSDVILDEVHYIDDYPRGAVWEEIVIQAPAHVRITGLSATVGNVDDIAGWMRSLRGETATVVKTDRPVDLKLWMATSSLLTPLLDKGQGLNPTLIAQLDAIDRGDRRTRGDHLGVIRQLRERGMLPAIYFIFSRRGCRDALTSCAMAGVDLTTQEEKGHIELELEQRLMSIGDDDERSVFAQSLDRRTLRRGLALHHAGMLPYAKETVEQLFIDGYIKVVFATETLSLGLNMPARSCVISTFTKFDGTGFASLTSGDVMQLTGRAGRRGIDTVGHGVIVRDTGVDLSEVYEACIGPPPHVISKFAPTYTMLLSLLKNKTRLEAQRLMELSLAHYQSDRESASSAMGIARDTAALAEITAHHIVHPTEPCDTETLRTYLQARAQIATAERALARERRGLGHRRHRGQGKIVALRRELKSAQNRVASVPCGGCPHLLQHRSQLFDVERLEKAIAEATDSSREVTSRFRRHVDALCRVLHELGFLDADHPTPLGHVAGALYGEPALLLAWSLHEDVFADMSPADLAATVAMVVNETRGRELRSVRFPTAAVEHGYVGLSRYMAELQRTESQAGIPSTRALAHEWALPTYDWAMGVPLEAIHRLPGQDLGDIVKAIRNVYSMLRQMEHAISGIPVGPLVSAARELLERDLIRRI